MSRTIDEIVPDVSQLTPELQFLVRYARFLDAGLRIPFTCVTIGPEAILGLFPIVGDAVGALLSLYIFVAAIRYRVPFDVLLRMAVHTAVDLGIGAVPFFGDIADVFYRDKMRNVALLLEHKRR